LVVPSPNIDGGTFHFSAIVDNIFVYIIIA